MAEIDTDLELALTRGWSAIPAYAKTIHVIMNFLPSHEIGIEQFFGDIVAYGDAENLIESALRILEGGGLIAELEFLEKDPYHFWSGIQDNCELMRRSGVKTAPHESFQVLRVMGFRKKRAILFGESGRIVGRFKATPTGLAAHARLIELQQNGSSQRPGIIQELLLNGLSLDGASEFLLDEEGYAFPSWCRYLGRAIAVDELRQQLNHLLAQGLIKKVDPVNAGIGVERYALTGEGTARSC
jgi:hypothetical protein